MARRASDQEKVRGVWERFPGEWWVRYRDADGKLRREKMGRKSDAIALLRKRREERRRDIKLPENLRVRGLRFKDLADDIEIYSRAHHGDHRSVLTRLRKVRPDWDDKLVDSIMAADIDAWLTQNTKTAATANRYRALFSLVFREAQKNGKVESNPARLVTQRRENSGVIRWLREDEEQAIRNAIAEHHPDSMVELDIALGLGMRLSEQYSLTWGQVDFSDKVVRLIKTKNFNGRSIPMNASVLAAFEELRERAPKAKLNDLVFEHYPRSWWDEILEAVGITDFRWHDLRHTFCTRLVKKGVNLKVIQLLAGHKTIITTARYAHADDADLRSAVDALTAA